MNDKDFLAKKQEYQNLTDGELLIEKKKLKQSKLLHAALIGFFFGILIFGIVGWIRSQNRGIGFLIPMIIPIVFIRKMSKSSKENKALEEVLKGRKL
jgi:hypothetical protein